MNYPLWLNPFDNQLVYYANENNNMLGRYVYEVQISTFSFKDFATVNFAVELIIINEAENGAEEAEVAENE